MLTQYVFIPGLAVGLKVAAIVQHELQIRRPYLVGFALVYELEYEGRMLVSRFVFSPRFQLT
jgi:hypothetical protein